ncbi:MAG: Rpn family recombination-promoting nuclease/putative transposase [Bifidobacteriaceae bacterium]|jgi:predicted transposase/invertase (TIGR01784 family)|nr:Rpn family recombination-promoting nuclease/putative transposase [Bifidobacteriaceae bacterium]
MPTSDLAFKKLLASDDHKRVTQGFIADFFGIEAGLDEIRIDNPYSIRALDVRARGGKLARLAQTFRDVTVAVGGADVVVELQLRLSGHFEARSLYYLFDRFASRYGQSRADSGGGLDWRYSSLRAVFGLNILGEEFREGPAALRVYRLYDPVLGEAMVPELVRVGYLDLTKTGGLSARQGAWREFLLTGVAPEGSAAYLAEAATMIEYANLDRKEREMADVLEKARATRAAEVSHAHRRGLEEGLERGLEQGRAEEARAVARRLLAMGVDPGAVADATGLDRGQLDQLRPGA